MRSVYRRLDLPPFTKGSYRQPFRKRLLLINWILGRQRRPALFRLIVTCLELTRWLMDHESRGSRFIIRSVAAPVFYSSFGDPERK